MDLFGHLRLLALPFLRGRLSTRTVLASLSGGGLSFQSTHVLVTVPSACCFLSWMSEDAFFRMLSSTSPQRLPVDIARMSSSAVLHRLGLGLGGFGASASKLNQFCPFATLLRVCLPECSFPWPAPDEAICILVTWKRGLLATRVGEASHPGPAVTADGSAPWMDCGGSSARSTPAGFPDVL